MEKSFARRCRNLGPFIWAIGFFGLLWMLDFPKPMVDDLMMCGAGLNLAGGGDFSNPLIVRQQMPGHFFFVYPPVHPHTVAGWVKVFGISTASLTAFQLMTYLATAIATVMLLRRHQAPTWLEWVTPLGVSFAFLPIGLRPEPLAVALIMAGFALVDGYSKRKIACLIGFLLLGLGTATAPRTAPFGVVLLALAIYGLWRDSDATGVQRWTLWAFALGGLLTAALIFLWLIDFRLGEFIAVFRFHAHHAVAGDKLMWLVRFLLTLGVTQRPILVVLLVLALWSLRHSVDDLARIGLCLTCALPCVALMGALGCGTIWFAVLGVLLLTVSVVRHTAARSARIVLLSLACAVLVVGNGKDLVSIVGIISGGIQSDASNRGEVVALRPTREHPLLIDAWVARYVFDYRLPPGCIDWTFSAPFPSSMEGVIVIRPGDIYLLGWYSVYVLTREGCLDLPTPKWVPLGLRRWSYEQQPRRAYLIRAEDCKPQRPPPAPPTGRAIWRSLLTGESIRPIE